MPNRHLLSETKKFNKSHNKIRVSIFLVKLTRNPPWLWLLLEEKTFVVLLL